MRIDRFRTLSLLLPAFVLLIGLFFVPLIYGIKTSLLTEGQWTWSHYAKILSDRREIATILNTFRIALPVTAISTLVAVLFAYFFRHGMIFDRLFNTLLILPMTLGTVLLSLGLLNILGKTGWINLVFGPDLKLIYNTTGVCIALFILHFPLSYLLTAASFSAIDRSLENAGLLLGATHFQVFRKILLPLALPGVLTAAALNFVGAFNVFPNAVLLGQPMGETRVLTISAYEAAFEYFDFAKGSAIALLMGLLQLIVVGLIFLIKAKTQPKGLSVKG